MAWFIGCLYKKYSFRQVVFGGDTLKHCIVKSALKRANRSRVSAKDGVCEGIYLVNGCDHSSLI